MGQKNFTIPIFIPELACPHQCLYCNQQKISGQQKLPSDPEILSVIDEHLQTISQGNHVELGFFGGNFTGIPQRDQKKYLKLIRPYLKEGKIQAIRCSTRPDYINKEVLEMLKEYGLKTIELGAQSMDEEVLRKSGRGHSVQDTVRASKLIRAHGFNLGLQMMIGLPGDTKEKAIHTAQRIVELGADNTRIYPTLVIKDTKLAELYEAGNYQALSMDEAVEWTAEIMAIFEQANISILRVGLHPSEGLMGGDDLLAGSFHQSFRELVYTEIWRKKLSEIKTDSDTIEICVHPRELNYAIGYHAKNKTELQKRFKKVKFCTNDTLKNREFSLC